MNRWIILSLGIFMLITGIFAVTNIKVEWSGPIAGFAALICGIVCIISFVKGTGP